MSDDYELRDLESRAARADDMHMREKQEAYDQIRTLRSTIATQSAQIEGLRRVLDMAFRHLKIMYPNGLEPGLAGDAMMQEIDRALSTIPEAGK